MNTPEFDDPALALGAPVGGGTLNPDNSKLVSLGAFGGSITLGFDHTVMDDPRNPMGLDAIVFGNAYWVGGNPNRRWAECAHVEISRDVNGNGLADDPWYLIPGSHIADPAGQFAEAVWDNDTADGAYPPTNPTWLPPGDPQTMPPPFVWMTGAFELPTGTFGITPVLANPDGPSAVTEGIRGYADLSPVLLRGDMNADNAVDDAGVLPEAFYTTPDDPFAVGVTAGSGGGDAFDIAWAVDPATGAPPQPPLSGFDFVRITSAVAWLGAAGPLGEVSAEVGGVADVAPPRRQSDFNGDGVVSAQDIFDFLGAFFANLPGADFDHSGMISAQDIFDFLAAWFAGL